MNELYDPRPKAERALLVGIEADLVKKEEAASLLRELAGLAKTLGLEVADSISVKIREKTASLLVGTGKADEIVAAAKAALPEDVEAVLVLTDAGHTDVSWLAGRPHTKVAQDFAPFVFARASNLGARAASGEALLFLNDDCFFRDPSDVHALCSALNDPSCGAVAPLATYAGNPDMRGQSATGEVRRTFRPLNGFCVALRRGTFYGVGGWDERYRGYGTDDDDLATQLMQRHYRLRVNGAVCVDHVGHASFGRDWEHIHSEIEKWGAVFAEKWGFPREGLASRFTDPEVSVVIPCYNAEEWIAECVASCFAQESAPSLEVVVVNDGSTDGSLEVLRALKARYGESLIVMTQPNAGPSAARNKGVRRSLGQTIVFQDADDLMPPTRVRDSVAALADLDLLHRDHGLPARSQDMRAVGNEALEPAQGLGGAGAAARLAKRDFFRAAAFQWIVPCWAALSRVEAALASSSEALAPLASTTARDAKRICFFITRLRRYLRKDCLWAFSAEAWRVGFFFAAIDAN